jgi:hypothetical protein
MFKDMKCSQFPVLILQKFKIYSIVENSLFPKCNYFSLFIFEKQ